MTVSTSESFADDTALEGGNGRYEVTLSPHWQGIGPFGGYLAALGLRAVGAETHLYRPATFHCQFLNVGQFAPAELRVETVRMGKRAACYRTELIQDGTVLMTAQVWAIDDGLQGFEHDDSPMPDMPKPDALKPLRAYFEERGLVEEVGTATLRLRDRRPLVFLGAAGGPTTPTVREWTRFEPEATFDDPFVDAGRTLVLLDNLVGMAHFAMYDDWSKLPYFLPSLDLTAQFHRTMEDADWLLGEGHADVATGGIAGGSARIWREDGALAATGTGVCLCKPRALYPPD